MRSSLDYAGFAQLCGRSLIMCKIMRAHNRIIPRSLDYIFPFLLRRGNKNLWNIFRLHWMHEMQIIVTDVHCVCLSVCLSHGLNRRQCVQCTPHAMCVWGYSVLPLSNYFDHLLLFKSIFEKICHCNIINSPDVISFMSVLSFAAHIFMLFICTKNAIVWLKFC